MKTNSQDELAYRADIDGLRAIAVMAVVLYHAEIPGFSGGFVGVDIFFVISGFLITRIIAAGARQGDFSYLEFYERRARRLLPALFLVAAAVVLFTVLFRSPRDTDIFGESVSLFALFAANVFFYNQLDYFADPVEFYPLLHTWSLAVEEQFYLIWPPLLLAIWSWRRNWLWPALAILVGASFFASLVAVAYDAQLAFFYTPFRMWQLGIGGLLALSPPPFLSQSARERAALLGLALLLAPIPLYSDQTLFPGLAAASPTLGAALVIAAGQGGSYGVAARCLSLRPVVFVGLVSYSFYLWHWPALSAARYLSFQPLGGLETLGVVAASFLLSVLTWRFVERPFRRPAGVVGRRGVFVGALAGVAALLLFGWAAQETKGLPGRFPELAPMFVEDARRYGPAPGQCAALESAVSPELIARIDPSSCRLHEAKADRPVYAIWGDSHAWALAPGLGEWAAEADVTLYVFWSASCPPFIGADRSYQSRFFDCGLHNAAVPGALRSLGASKVFLAAQWSGQAQRLNFEEELARTAQALRGQGAEPVVIAEAPPHLGHVPTVLFRAAALGSPYPLSRNRTELEAGVIDSFRELSAAAASAKIRVVAPADVLCPNDLCAVQAPNRAPLYADGHHLNRLGARSIGLALGRRLIAAD